MLQTAVIAAILGLIIGYLIARLKAQREIQQLSVTIARLETELEGDAEHYESQLALLHEARDSMAQHFAMLSQKALSRNNSLFLRLADQNLKLQQHRTQTELDKREQAVDELIAPIKASLERTEQQIQAIEKERKQSFGELSAQIRQLAQTESSLQSETRNLVHALKRPDVRGRWGEMTLKRLVELAGMVEHADFAEQVSHQSEQQRFRPDMIIRMPDHRELIVDAKTPLSAYLAAIDAENDELRDMALKKHARNLRERMKELAAKQYWAQFENTPDFVVLFIPGDQFLTAALEQDPNLLEDSLRNNIVLATPSSLIAMLRAVAFGWRQARFSANAEQIRTLGEELYTRISTLTEHFARLGQSLNSSVDHFNKAIGSLEKQLIPSARKMHELGISAKKDPAAIEPLEKVTRPVGNNRPE
ncbi:MAG TPA: DNA recombination protein RmuC [Gammaproteobacteria bacterium]|nr:DNA recombination protein RmuC [Gammaproteobacteria bacterium]